MKTAESKPTEAVVEKKIVILAISPSAVKHAEMPYIITLARTAMQKTPGNKIAKSKTQLFGSSGKHKKGDKTPSNNFFLTSISSSASSASA